MPPGIILPVFKSLTSVQLVPFHNSVKSCGLGELGNMSPAKHKADVLLAPAPAVLRLAVFRSLTSVQFVPFQLSDKATFVVELLFPPKAIAEVYVPPPLTPSLPVFKSLTSVQDDPSHYICLRCKVI